MSSYIRMSGDVSGVCSVRIERVHIDKDEAPWFKLHFYGEPDADRYRPQTTVNVFGVYGDDGREAVSWDVRDVVIGNMVEAQTLRKGHSDV